MEYYNQLFLQQLAPYVLVQLNDLCLNVRNELSENFKLFSVDSKCWDNSIIKSRISNSKYIVGVTESSNRVKEKSTEASDDEYSLLSPFNKDSDLFPNGILSEKWFKKYITDTPFAVISTFNFPNSDEEYLKVSNELSDLKSYYSKMYIHFIALVISNNEDNGKDEHTITQLRSITGLPRGTGLIYLNSSNTHFHRDVEVVVTSIFSSLRNFATEFYGRVDNRIKQRYKKYYTYPSDAKNDATVNITPKFLETRNLIKQAIIRQFIQPNNLTLSLKLLESSYQNLIIILKENFQSFSESLSSQDLRLYKQIRVLLDILAFHIVRGYISIEDPLTALKKHKVHVDNVMDAVNGASSHFRWMSLQYEWLGDLLSLIPSSLILNVGNNKGKKTEKNVGFMNFIGGIHYTNNFEMDIFTNPGQIYFQAYYFQKKSLSLDTDKHYITFQSNIRMSEKVHELLTKGQEFFLLNDLKNFGIDDKQKTSLCWYIKLMQAEDIFSNCSESSINDCIKLYEELLKDIETGSWTICITSILQRLIFCYQDTEDYSKLLSCIIKLAKHGDKINRMLDSVKSADISFNDLEKVTNMDSLDFVDVKGFIISSYEAKTDMDENDFLIQVNLTSLIQIDILRCVLPKDYTISLNINRVLVDLVSFNNEKKSLEPEEFSKIEVIHDENISNSGFQSISDNKGSNVYKANLHGNSFKVLHILQKNNTYVISKLVSLNSIEVESSIILEKEGNSIEICNKTRRTYDLKSNNFSIIDIYSGDSFDKSGKFVRGSTKSARIRNRLPHTIQIIPLKPTIKVIPKFPESIYIGEKMKIPCSITFENISDFSKKLSLLSTKTSIIGEGISNEIISNIATKINWENSKDDIPLELKNKHEETNLELVVLISPHYSNQLCNNISVYVSFQAFVSDNDEQNNIVSNSVPYEIFSHSLQVRYEQNE